MEETINNLYLNDFVFAGIGILHDGKLMAIKMATPEKTRARAKAITRGLNSGKWYRVFMSKLQLMGLYQVEAWRNITAVKLSFAEYAAIICK